MPGKRKMNDMSSGESQEKLSKKAKLKLARERAAKYAERDKAKIESHMGKKPGTVSPKANVESKSPRYGIEQKVPETMTGTAMAVESPSEKMPLAERREIAKKNAKEFAARDRATLISKKAQNNVIRSAFTTTATNLAPPQQVSATDPSPMDVVQQSQHPLTAVGSSQLPKQKKFGVAIDPNQVAEYERTRQIQYTMMQQQLAKQTQESKVAGHSRTGAASHPATLHMSSDTASEALLGGGNGETNVIIGNDKNFVEEIDDEDIMPPPPPSLMAQVSQQVLLNARNDDEDSENPVSVEDEKRSEGKEDQEIAIDGNVVYSPAIDRKNQHLQTTSRMTRWLPNITSVIIIGVAISSIILMLPMPSNEKMLKLPSDDDTEIQKEVFCYHSSESDSEDYCSNVANSMECPKGGVCKHGKLVACDNPFQDVSNQGNECVLGEEYLPMKAALTNELVRHASTICDQSTKPSFKYSLLQENNSTIPEIESEDLIEALIDEGFVVYNRDGLYVGLPEGFNVSLPVYCHLGNIGQLIVQLMGLVLLGILRFVFSNLLGFVLSYPELSFLILIVFICVFWYRRYIAAKKKRQTDTMRTRELAYKTLEESCGVEHCAIHIRDEIAMSLYPNSKKARLKMQKSIWPKIVDDVKRDTRVRKFQTFTRDGKTRDMWQWTAASKTPSKA